MWLLPEQFLGRREQEWKQMGCEICLAAMRSEKTFQSSELFDIKIKPGGLQQAWSNI